MFVFYILTSKNLVKFMGNHQFQSLVFYLSCMEKRLQHSYFPVNFLRNFWKHYLKEHLRVTAYVGHGVRL